MDIAKVNLLTLTSRGLLISCTLFAGLAQAIEATKDRVDSIDTSPAPNIDNSTIEAASALTMTYHDGLLSVKSDNASVRSVLQLIARETGCVLMLASEPEQNATIQIEFSAVPLRIAIAELLKDVPHQATYVTDPASNSDVLSRLEVTPRNGTKHSIHADESAAAATILEL